MKIKRVVNGEEIEFELTGSEMHEAYWEYEHNCTTEDIKTYLEDWEDEDKPVLTEDQVDRAAYYVEDWVNDSDTIAEVRWDCVAEAIGKIVKEDVIKKVQIYGRVSS